MIKPQKKAPHGPVQPKAHMLEMYKNIYGLDPGEAFDHEIVFLIIVLIDYVFQAQPRSVT